VITEGCAGTSHRFGNKETGELGVLERGGVELLEFHLCDGCTGVVGEGDSVAGSDSGVCGVAINFAASAGGEHCGFGGELGGAEIVDDGIGTDALSFGDEEIGDEAVFVDLDGRVFTDGFADGAFDFPSGFVGVVNDAMA